MTLPRPDDPGPDEVPRRFELVSRWDLDTPPDRVWSALADRLDAGDPFPWWDDVRAVGRSPRHVDVEVHSGLGYRLRLRLADLWTEPPHALGLGSTGDLVGTARITLDERGTGTRVVIVWCVDPGQAWMRVLSVPLGAFFRASHAAVMRRGRAGLRRWLADPSTRG